MAVHLTRIYTRTGDAGTTALGDGIRVSKTDPRIEAYADVEEANAAIGVALALGDLPDDLAGVLMMVQNDLFDVGADLCAPIESEAKIAEATDSAAAPRPRSLRVTEPYVQRLEDWCDEYNAQLPELDSFILPGGARGAALLHVARTICRRAERDAWRLVELDPERTNPVSAVYLNRLSDLLFILGRATNPDGDIKWVPGGMRSPQDPRN